MKDKHGRAIIPDDIIEGLVDTPGGRMLRWHRVMPGDEFTGWRDFAIIGNARDNPEMLRDWRMQ